MVFALLLLSLFLFFSFALFLLFFTFFLFLLISLFILFLFCFCFRPQKPELNPKPRTLHPAGQPSAGQPSAGQPSAGQPSTRQPSTGQPPDNPPTDNPPPDNPPPDRPKIRSFFSLLPPQFSFFFLSLGVLSWNFVGVFEGRNPEMCTFGLSGCRVKPRRPQATRLPKMPKKPTVPYVTPRLPMGSAVRGHFLLTGVGVAWQPFQDSMACNIPTSCRRNPEPCTPFPPTTPPLDTPPPDNRRTTLHRTPHNFAFFFALLRHNFHSSFSARVSHDSPRAQTCTFQGPGASNTTKIPRDPQRERKRAKLGREREKKKRNVGPAAFGPPPFGPQPLGR